MVQFGVTALLNTHERHGEIVGNSFLSLFADDIINSRPVTSVDEVLHPQEDLNAAYAWAAASNMQFNEENF